MPSAKSLSMQNAVLEVFPQSIILRLTNDMRLNLDLSIKMVIKIAASTSGITGTFRCTEASSGCATTAVRKKIKSMATKSARSAKLPAEPQRSSKQ